MKVLLEQNGGKNSSEVPYFAVVEISTISVDRDHAFRVPIHLTKNGTSKYNAEVCGFRVEGRSPEEVEGLVEKLVPGLVNMARLPTYVFVARRSHQMYPVYTVGDEVFVTTPGGPLFRHVELAKIRDYLTEYLHTVGELGVPGKSEKLHVRGVHRLSLQLIRPLFYLKKRGENGHENEFWAPVFPSMTSDAIYTYAASGRREVELDKGYEVFSLRHQVALALIADKRLNDEADLRADRLLPEYFERVKENLSPLSSKLVQNGMEMPIYKARSKVAAVEYRDAEDRYSFYVGTDLEDLRLRAAKDLVRRGLTASVDTVKVVG
ncbi:MAG: hypothetical protein FOGNACKC_01511 [Anaerolineae bacterium]|nr:hypothetical protein [Anaerolineae bacterium]